MLSGMVSAALKLLSDIESAGIVSTSKQINDFLNEKHPAGASKYDDRLLHGPEGLYEQHAYEEITAALICKIPYEIKGTVSPSKLDEDVRHCILISSYLGDNSRDLCSAIALAKNNPGVRPIEIGEVIRRILGHTVMKTFRRNIFKSAGDLQLCAGQHEACEASVHALSSTFSEDDSDAIFLLDADNVFNRINRNVLLCSRTSGFYVQ